MMKLVKISTRRTGIDVVIMKKEAMGMRMYQSKVEPEVEIGIVYAIHTYLEQMHSHPYHDHNFNPCTSS